MKCKIHKISMKKGLLGWYCEKCAFEEVLSIDLKQE